MLDCILLGGRERGLQLVGDGFRYFALDGEDIGQIAVVGLRPEMRVVPGIDQLRVHAHFVADALDTSLNDVRHSELPADLAQITRRAALDTA